MKTTLIVATTLDGYIAQAKEQVSTAWTSVADKNFFMEKSKELGVMVMGSNTFATMGKPLPGRMSVVYTVEKPLLSENGVEKIPLLSGLVQNGELTISEWIKKEGLDQKAFYTDLQPDELCTLFTQKEYENLAICGGAGIYQLFLTADAIDEIQMTIEPVFFGSGIKLFGDTEWSDMKKLQLLSMERLANSETMLLVLTVKNN